MQLRGKTYLVLEKGRYGHELRIVTCRSKKPKLTTKQLAVKVEVQISSKAFEDLLPTAIISIPDAALIPPTVEIEAQSVEDADDEDDDED